VIIKKKRKFNNNLRDVLEEEDCEYSVHWEKEKDEHEDCHDGWQRKHSDLNEFLKCLKTLHDFDQSAHSQQSKDSNDLWSALKNTS
jgi:hypothetical protein